MAGSAIVHKRDIKCRTKVKTGCATCRIRKVKCDEGKPSCRRCVSTGRTCDGYESPFRHVTSRPINNAHASAIKSDVGLRLVQPALVEVDHKDVDLLNRYFSTKTMFDVELDCDEEAKQVLQASLTDPPIRHAVLSLKALREDLETSGYSSESVPQQTKSSYHYGLQQYNLALGGLVSNLSSLGSNGLKSALLCCQIFISIEQVRKNYAAMVQHIIRGLRIMHEYGARPALVAPNELVPAYYDQLPFLDVFIIKMFAAPCKFAEPPATADASRTTSPGCLSSSHLHLVESGDLRAIAPNMRTQLTRIATSTVEFLGKVSQVKSVEIAVQLLSDKAALLDSLESWLIDLELVQTDIRSPGPEPVSVSFLRLFYLILKVVLLGALDASPDLEVRLQTESEQMQDIANDLSERLRDYRMPSGTTVPKGGQ